MNIKELKEYVNECKKKRPNSKIKKDIKKEK